MATFTCSGINPDVGTAQTLVGAVDCFVDQAVAQSYGALTNPGSSYGILLTAALTIYIALIGFQFMLGRTQLRLGDLVPKFMLMGAVLALTASWGTWQILVYDVLTDGPEEITQLLNGGNANARSITERVDYVSGLATDVATAWTRSTSQNTPATTAPNAPSTPQSPTDLNGSNQVNDAQRATAALVPNVTGNNSPGPNILIWSALLFTLASAGVLAISKALLALLLALGPLFVLLALFRVTRDLLMGWAQAALFLALIPLLSMLSSLAALELVEPMAESMGNAANQNMFSLKSAVALFVTVLVFIGVSLLIFRVAQIMTGRWTLGISKSADSPQPINETYNSQQTGLANAAPLSTNPRVDVLLSAMERNLYNTQSAAPQSDGDVRREIVNASQISRANQQANSTLPAPSTESRGPTPQRRIDGTRLVQSRSTLRPVRGGA